MNLNYKLIDACEKGNLKRVKTFVSKGTNIHTNGVLALRVAAYWGHLEVVKYLVDEGADIHWLALRWAAENGHTEVVMYLVDKGANVHAEDDQALRYAACNGHLEIVKYLVAEGANIHADNDYALYWAAYHGHLEVVKYLKGVIITEFTKRHIDKINIKYVSEQYKLPGEIQQLILGYV